MMFAFIYSCKCEKTTSCEDANPCSPVRTYDTACVYYHKFRLVHKDNEYNYPDAAAAALLTACKIEDTLKKSKEILCAAHNLRVSPSDHLSSDDVVSAHK
jgi:CTD kinase subunit beta